MPTSYISLPQFDFTTNTNDGGYEDWQLEILEEQVTPLSKLWPDEFARYCRYFYDFWPKKGYHAKREYQSGFIHIKKKNGCPQFCFRQLIEQHLDWEHYQNVDYTARFRKGKSERKHSEFYWVALNPPKQSKIAAIDYDNKDNVVGYFKTESGPSETWLPLAAMTLADFTDIKRLHDEFPNRVWCISSATMGLHIVETFKNLKSLYQIELDYRPRLAKIGLPTTEVHPMKGRCWRRPFGTHYFTITEDGLLSDWKDQLEFFENPKPVSFSTIYTAIRGKLDTYWEQYRGSYKGLYHPNYRTKENPLWSKAGLLRPLMEEIRRCDEWAKSGFAVSEIEEQRGNTPVPLRGTGVGPNKKSPKAHSPRSAVTSEAIDFKQICDGRWVQTVCNWAQNGLPCEDSFYTVYASLAVWFYYIELYHLSEEDREERIFDLLKSHLLLKHNGFVTSLDVDDPEEVFQRLKATISSAIDKSENKFAWVRVRQKREQGKYKVIYRLEPNMLTSSSVPVGIEIGNSPHTPSSPPLLPLSLDMLVHFEFSPDYTELPEVVAAIEFYYEKKRLRLQKRTKQKLVAFLNHLAANQFCQRLDVQRLKMMGFGDGRQRKHLKHLMAAGILYTLRPCRDQHIAKGFGITKEFRAIYYEHRRQKEQVA